MAELTATLTGFAQRTTETNTTAQHRVGSRGYDQDGNEYRYVKCTDAVGSGGWVVLDGSYNATRVTTTSRGSVGVTQTSFAANDFGWIMVYGLCSAAQIGDSEATSAYGLLAPTGATTEPIMAVTSSFLTSIVSGPIANPVIGAKITAAATTATTNVSSTFSGVTVEVQLNYPFLAGLSIERLGST